jgi:hypothetical protein
VVADPEEIGEREAAQEPNRSRASPARRSSPSTASYLPPPASVKRGPRR